MTFTVFIATKNPLEVVCKLKTEAEQLM